MQRFLGYRKSNVPRAQALRREMTGAEKKLWYQFLRLQSVPILRQRPINRFIVDFYCASRKLVIEVDGAHHYTPEGKAKDAERTQILEGLGLTVIRFSNNEVTYQFEPVCQALKALLETTPQTKHKF